VGNGGVAYVIKRYQCYQWDRWWWIYWREWTPSTRMVDSDSIPQTLFQLFCHDIENQWLTPWKWKRYSTCNRHDPWHDWRWIIILQQSLLLQIAALFNSDMDANFCVDNQQKTPLDYARDCNVGGLVGMMNKLCSHRKSSKNDHSAFLSTTFPSELRTLLKVQYSIQT